MICEGTPILLIVDNVHIHPLVVAHRRQGLFDKVLIGRLSLEETGCPMQNFLLGITAQLFPRKVDMDDTPVSIGNNTRQGTIHGLGKGFW